jgi:hypothetical protein
MSTSPNDRIVALLSRWLARHIGDDELLRQLTGLGTDGLSPGDAEAVGELTADLRAGRRHGELEVAVRETLEALTD